MDNNANIDAQDNKGKTPLMYVAEEIFTVKELLYRGANPHIEDNDGKTFFDYIDDEDKDEIKEYMKRNTINIKPAK